jgi:hypothetical protein
MDKIKKDENLPNKEGNNIEDFNFEGEREATTFLIHMIAGSIAGLMEHVVLFPIDTIKVIKYFIFKGSYANIIKEKWYI